jgi:TPR repeat protein
MRLEAVSRFEPENTGFAGQDEGPDFPKGACAGGDMRGCYLSGVEYAAGSGAPKDEVRAAVLFKQACDRRDLAGSSYLGFMYEKGKGLARDMPEALRLYARAAPVGPAVAATT